MTDLLVLGDSAVRQLLTSLTVSEVSIFQAKLEETLRQFSVEEERKYQPEPGVVKRPNGQKSLFRTFTSPTSIGAKVIIDPAPEIETGKKFPLRGTLVLCDENGFPSGIINAAEVTGFRTSLSAIIPFTWRREVKNVVVFGAGKQALWHIRLALTLRGEEIETLTLVNRSRERAQSVVDQIRDEKRLASKTRLAVLDHSVEDYYQKLKDVLGVADVIFCTVPSEKQLFSEADLRLSSEHKPYVSAIGSWMPDMIELHPKLLVRTVQDEKAIDPRGESSQGVIIVDDRESASKDSGEVIGSGLGKGALVELGEILDIRAKTSGSPEGEQLAEWLRDGLIVYKSIGVGLTDKATGEAIIELAKQQGLGQVIKDF